MYLCSCVTSLSLQKSYLLRRYATVMISNQTIKRSFMKVATTRGKKVIIIITGVIIFTCTSTELCEPFLEFAKSLNVRNCILVDMVRDHVFQL